MTETATITPLKSLSIKWRWCLFILGIVFLFFLIFNRLHQSDSFVSGIVDEPSNILATTQNRTNIVFLGFRQAKQTDDNLTDSIMFISLNHQTKQVTLFSLPRDIWVDSLVAKINTAYHYGQKQSPGGGLDLAMSAISEVTGQPVHYALALDFNGFIKAIDAIGGIDVDIQRSFDDYKYPIPGKENAFPESDRYQHLHFEAGPTHMDGQTALQFARSRHAEGEEGTDFARSNRQHQIIVAFQKKLLSTQTLLNLKTLQNTFFSLQSSIHTNINQDELVSLFRFFLSSNKQHPDNNFKLLKITDFFIPLQSKSTSKYKGQWVLIPSTNWSSIHEYLAKNI